MIFAYFNYPNKYISVHSQNNCKKIEQNKKKNQRKVSINSQNVDTELNRFHTAPKFASNADENDMWVSVDLNDEAHELKIIASIKEILGARYLRFRNVEIERHC